MYDLFIYVTPDGYLLEYDPRESEATPLLTYFKRHVLRSKVKFRSVTDEYDVWCSWGSPKDRDWESKRDWRWAHSGAVEPVWQDVESGCWPGGLEPLVINDRRAVGMGRRLLVQKGTARTTHSLS
jgi:folate-binding Fe-S cluster repair protein YgfZ